MPEITPLFDAAEIRNHVAQLARQIDATYSASHDLVLVGVLRGAVYFLADLSRALQTPHRIDFVEYASYHGTRRARGRLVRDCTGPIEGADVVIVDEVRDSGRTLSALRETLARKRPRSLAACVLFVKENPNAGPLPEFHGPVVGPGFLVGYGMDLDQRYRHLPWVGTVTGRGHAP